MTEGMSVGKAGGPPGRSGPGPEGMRDWTQGNVFRNLLLLSWPMVVSNVLMMLGPTIDMIWVGRLGSESMAAVGTAGIAVQLLMSAMFGLIMGVRALIARLIGTGDFRGANHVAQQGLVLAAIAAVVMAGLGFFLTDRILGLFRLDAAVVALGATYLRIMFIGGAAMTFRVMGESVMQAAGDVITPMVTATIYRILHIVLAPFLIFGWWIFPDMGVAGAAMTNVISQTLAVIMGFWYLFGGHAVSFGKRRRPGDPPPLSGTSESSLPWWLPRFGPGRLRLTLRDFSFDRDVIWRILRIGAPAMISGMQRTATQFILLYFVAPFGTAAVAAHTVVQRVEMILFMPGMAFGTGAGVLVGQNLGANQPERAERGVWLATAIVEGIVLTCSLAIFLWPEAIIRVFNSEPAVLEIAVPFLRIAVVGFAVVGFASVMMMALSSAGDTVIPMLVTITTVWAVQLPLIILLPKVGDLGVFGIRWAIVIGMLISAAVYVWYFRLGRWKHKQVLSGLRKGSP